MLAMQTILFQDLGENQLTADVWIDCLPNFLVWTIACFFIVFFCFVAKLQELG